MWAITPGPEDSCAVSLQAAFDLESLTELSFQKSVITDGLLLFERIFGYRATFFVPPNGPFCSCLEKTAADCGVRYMSTAKIHREPPGSGCEKTSFRWLGKLNAYGQRYITRNCFFEPSSPGQDWTDTCMKEIAIAFRWRKPAIISSHRVNFIGALDRANRDRGLKQLKVLLDRIVTTWPDVVFLTSDKLGDLISSSDK
jgi:hypothetical protein